MGYKFLKKNLLKIFIEKSDFFKTEIVFSRDLCKENLNCQKASRTQIYATTIQRKSNSHFVLALYWTFIGCFYLQEFDAVKYLAKY